MPALPVIAPQPPRHTFKFALPPSLGSARAIEVTLPLEHFLSEALGKRAEVTMGESYEGLAKDLLSGKVDAAWAPPFVCARIEAMGVRVLVRGVRRGASSYRGALLCRAESPLTLESLSGTAAAWTDRDSVAGYLLPMALLRAKGLNPGKLFYAQDFLGSYQAAVEAVLDSKADVTSVYAPPARPGQPETTSVEQIAGARAKDLSVVAFTDESPNDGVAVAMSTPAAVVTALERSLLSLHSTSEGARLLKDTFEAEQFEPAPRMGYRALYRVALASL
ncbi:MAG: phosphate/phosphite/phosphonate ABC transporter substrate-binding protein [Myxococcales bacterium]|nr:phosphate/phosphite/phosphonate ABC transporter substrate-binding protein [Myxococcales bacterium]